MTAIIENDPTWRTRLHNAGLRVTRSRLMILELLSETGGHQTAEVVNEMLKSAGTPLARGTVYNVLDDLVGAELVMQADRGPGTAIYEIAEEWHHHFVCGHCGAVVDVPCVVGEKPCLHVDLPGADLAEAQIIFRGTCADCVAKGLGNGR